MSNLMIGGALPNSYRRFTGQLEEEDYIAYCRYVESLNGQKLFDRLEKADGKDYVELFGNR